MSDVITDMELSRLYDCATSNRYGMVDKGFPLTFTRLEALGYVSKKNDGWIITTLGSEYIKLNRTRLFLGNSKSNRRRRKHDMEYSDEFTEE